MEPLLPERPNFEYRRQLEVIGGSGHDSFTVNGLVGGSGTLNLGGSFPGGVHSVAFTGGIGNSFTVLGSAGADSLPNFLGTVGGSLVISPGAETNTLDLGGFYSGHSVTYFGGSGSDVVTFNFTAGAPLARFTAFLGSGNDSFTLNSNTLDSLFVDFGSGADTFTVLPALSLPLPSFIFNL